MKILALACLLASQAALAQDKVSNDFMAQSHSVMQKMNKDMTDMKMTGKPDTDFVMMMIPHHQGAIDMSTVYLKHGKDTKIRKMAEEIIAAQKKEIKDMNDWLAKNK